MRYFQIIIIRSLVFILLFLPFIINAQGEGIIRGVVKDSLNGEVLPYGNVLIKELRIGSSTNEDGYFVIPSLPAGKEYTVSVSYVGYQTSDIKAVVLADKITDLEIFLVPLAISLETVEITSEMTEEGNAPNIGKIIISPREMEAIPKGVETDILRGLTTLPGVKSAGGVSAKYSVRGGEYNQNLVLLDNMPVYYPFHSIGLFSVIDPDIIKNIELYKGGFPAELGRAASSILKISTRDGNRYRFGGKFSASLMSGKIMAEGPVPNGSFYASFRKSASNSVLKNFVDDNDLPIDFYEGAFKINYANPHFFNNTKFTFQGLFSKDKLNYADAGRPDYEWANSIFGFNMFVVGEIPFFLDFDVVLSSYSNKIIPKESTVSPKRNELSDFTMSADFLYILSSKDELGLGIDFKAVDTKLFLVNRFDYEANIGLDGISSNAYIKYKFLRFENLGVDIGSRFNLKDLAARGDFFEPRININYVLSPSLSLKGSYGVYQQDLITITDEREALTLFEPMIIIDENFEKTKASMISAGILTKFSSYLNLELEGYYKDIYSSPVFNENKSLFSDPDLLPGSGDAYGAELLTKYRSPVFDFTAGYSYSIAEREAEGYRYSPRHDARHSLNLSFTLYLPYGIRFSSSWAYSSGRPYTQQIGFYDKLSISGYFESFNIYSSSAPFLIYGLKNAERLPDYHRLDITLAKKLDLNFMVLNADVSVVNIYDRKNIFYFDQNSGKRINMLPLLVTGTIKVEI